MCEIVENCITYQRKLKNSWLVTLVPSFQGSKWAIEILLGYFSIVNNQGEINQLRMEEKSIAIIKIYTWRKENNNWGKSKWLHIFSKGKICKTRSTCSFTQTDCKFLCSPVSLEAKFVSYSTLHQQQKAKHRQTFNTA